MRTSAVFALVLLTSPVFAAATDWQELAPEARARLISSDVLGADGTTLVAIEIDMPMATKTYWRIPGETGIPIMLDLDRSQGIAGHEILWPFPTREQTDGYLDYVYHGPTVLPVRLTVAGADPLLELDVTLGICSDICVPVQARFSLPLGFAAADAGQGLRIDQALAGVPLPAPDDTVIGAVEAGPDGLIVPLTGADIDPASVIAAGADPAALFGAPQKSPDNGIVILPLLGGTERPLVGQDIEIIFMTSAGPYVVNRTIAAAGSTPAVR